MTESRPGMGELVSAGCALALLVLLLATAWYGVAGVPDPTSARPVVSGTESGWDGLTDVRWVIVVTTLVAIGAVALRISQREHGRQTDASRLVTALGLLCSALLVYRVLIALPSPDKVIDQKLGALLGLACAFGIALGGHESLQQRRSRPATISHRRGRPPTPRLTDAARTAGAAPAPAATTPARPRATAAGTPGAATGGTPETATGETRPAATAGTPNTTIAGTPEPSGSPDSGSV